LKYTAGQNQQKETSMSFLVFGAGAIGAYIGGSLLLAGHKVIFIEKPDFVEVLREKGLRLSIKGEEHHLNNLFAAGHLETALSLGPYDAVLFALKSYHTKDALHMIAPYAAQMPPFVCLQNGVENEHYLAEVVGKEKVIAATVTSAVGRRALGSVVLEKRRGIGIWNGHKISHEVGEAFEQAGLNPFFYPDPLSMKWSKLIVNLLANATSAILDMTPADIYRHTDLVKIETLQVREALRVMKAKGLHPVNLPRTPVRLLALAYRLPTLMIKPLLYKVVGQGRGAKMPSFHIDLYNGPRPSEVEYLNGAVVRHADQLNLPAPVNQTLTHLLVAMSTGSISINEYAKRPEKLVEEIRQFSQDKR
jgi:2-dehydropantoate 2-reductase